MLVRKASKTATAFSCFAGEGLGICIPYKTSVASLLVPCVLSSVACRIIFEPVEYESGRKNRIWNNALHVLIERYLPAGERDRERVGENHPTNNYENAFRRQDGYPPIQGCISKFLLGVGYDILLHILWADPREIAIPEIVSSA